MIDIDPYHPPCVGCLRAKGHRLPVHRAFFEGRSDWDWFRSVVKYLEFRAGTAWRPARHSGACVVDDYRDALFVVTQAFHQPPPIVSCALPRKPPQKATIVTKELSDAETCG